MCELILEIFWGHCPVQGRNHWGSGVRTLPTFLLTPQFWTAFNMGGRFNSFVLNVFLCFLWNVDFFKISLSTYTRLNDMKFKIPKIFWGGTHRAPSPRSFSGFALDSGFALKSWVLRALDSGFARFGPPTFEAWLSPWPCDPPDLPRLIKIYIVS